MELHESDLTEGDVDVNSWLCAMVSERYRERRREREGERVHYIEGEGSTLRHIWNIGSLARVGSQPPDMG